ncbi:hypothetical protein AVEN_263183-1 [Araneus ventricosus]|uniref:Uncharacterized protein n=1 Tax=Araneus ventricosus TaxID=182803 RepID=A0A4Y2WQ17_ARAVE|nr:hypothetical protein AVEN_263183-1 [Araneus ventricosus]
MEWRLARLTCCFEAPQIYCYRGRTSYGSILVPPVGLGIDPVILNLSQLTKLSLNFHITPVGGRLIHDGFNRNQVHIRSRSLVASSPESSGSILVPRLGWETSLFPPVNDECNSRTRFSNRLGYRLVEKRTPISRQLCTWRERYSLARSVVSISELIKF